MNYNTIDKSSALFPSAFSSLQRLGFLKRCLINSMQSILLVSKNRKITKEYIDKLSNNEGVDRIDIDINYFEKTVGIEDVRTIQKKILFRPFRGRTKVVVIEAYEGITIESQNALLKILEEPPNNTIIVINVAKIDLILPTILSRCKIIDLKDKSLELSKQEVAQYLNLLVSLPSSGIGDRLKLAQDIAKNKDEITTELEKMIIIARKTLIESICHSDPELTKREESHDSATVFQYLNILISLQKTYILLKTTNVNQRLALENLFLNINI